MHEASSRKTITGETATKIVELLSIGDLDAKTIHLMSGETCMFLKPSLNFLKKICFIYQKRDKFSLSKDGHDFLKNLNQYQ